MFSHSLLTIKKQLIHSNVIILSVSKNGKRNLHAISPTEEIKEPLKNLSLRKNAEPEEVFNNRKVVENGDKN